MESKYLQGVARTRLARRRLLKAGGVFSVGAASLAILGCDSGDENQGTGGGSGTAGEKESFTPSLGDPRRGGKYAGVHSGTNNHSVVENSQAGHGIYGITAYDRPLTGKADSRRYVLEGVAKIEIADSLKVVMTLKPNMTYHNKPPVSGRPVVSADIKATQEFVKVNPASYNSTFQRVHLDRVEAPDDFTVIYHLTYPSAYLFTGSYLGSPHSQVFIPRETIESLRDEPPIGSGPYELTSFQHNGTYAFKRFEGYRDASSVYFDQREVLGITDPIAQESAFRSGQLSYWVPTGSIVDRLKGELDASKFHNYEYLSTVFNGINGMTDKTAGGARPWNDIRVREAFYRALNVPQIAELGFRGQAVETTGLIPQGLQSEYLLEPAEVARFVKFDLAEARRLLSAAGYESSKTWDAITSTVGAGRVMGEIVQQQLSQAGINIRPVAMPTAELLNRIRVSEFDLYIGASNASDSPARPLRYQHSETGFAFSHMGLYDSGMDALIEQSEREVNYDKHVALVKAIQKKGLESYAMSRPLITERQVAFYDSRLQNLEIDRTQGGTYLNGAWFSA